MDKKICNSEKGGEINVFAATPHHEKTHIGLVEDNSNLLTQTLKVLKSLDFKAFVFT